uniref:Uncharacterized protein n=1 Tax=Anguilla anguilla TaxID=7936 RepID=A0A0E9XRK4_ANGAN
MKPKSSEALLRLFKTNAMNTLSCWNSMFSPLTLVNVSSLYYIIEISLRFFNYYFANI